MQNFVVRRRSRNFGAKCSLLVDHDNIITSRLKKRVQSIMKSRLKLHTSKMLDHFWPFCAICACKWQKVCFECNKIAGVLLTRIHQVWGIKLNMLLFVLFFIFFAESCRHFYLNYPRDWEGRRKHERRRVVRCFIVPRKTATLYWSKLDWTSWYSKYTLSLTKMD